MPPLPEGDFTKSEHWPRLRYGLPDKVDILDAQNQVMAQHLVKEAEKREEGETNINQNLGGLHRLLSAIATKLEIDASTISAAAPSSRTKAAAAKVDSDRDLINNLDKHFVQRMTLVSADYAGRKFQDLMKQKNTANVAKENLVEKWSQYIRQKALQTEIEVLDKLTPNQISLLYFRMSKELSDAANATAAGQAKASGTSRPGIQQSGSPSATKKRKVRQRQQVLDDEDDDIGGAEYGENPNPQMSPFGADATYEIPVGKARPREGTPSQLTPTITLSESHGFARATRPRSVLFSDHRSASSSLLAHEAAAEALHHRQVSTALGFGADAYKVAIPAGGEEDEEEYTDRDEDEERDDQGDVFGIPKQVTGSDQGSARTILRKKGFGAGH